MNKSDLIGLIARAEAEESPNAALLARRLLQSYEDSYASSAASIACYIKGPAESCDMEYLDKCIVRFKDYHHKLNN